VRLGFGVRYKMPAQGQSGQGPLSSFYRGNIRKRRKIRRYNEEERKTGKELLLVGKNGEEVNQETGETSLR